jgi:hypothetical protein
LGVFPTEKTACDYAVSYAKSFIDGAKSRGRHS